MQAATLVGIPQSPTRLNPKAFPEECRARRNDVLERMFVMGDITQEEYDEAVAEPLELDPEPPAPYQGIYAYPYFTSFVRDQLLKENNQLPAPLSAKRRFAAPRAGFQRCP